MVKLAKRVNFSRFASSFISKTAPLKAKSQSIYTQTAHIVEKRPLFSFFGVLLFLLLAIILGNFITEPKPVEEAKTKEPIAVDTYSVGSAPRITVSAQIEKEGVIKITAQTAGIVSKVNVTDGQSVTKGKVLVSLSSNYQGASVASVQRQLALVQAKSAKVTFDSQIEQIAKQREIAEKTDASADELRSITRESADETKQQVSLNESILSTIENNVRQLETTNVGGTNDALILQTKQLQSQFASATNQARSALRSAELQADENKPPSQLSSLTKDVTLKQLDLQEKTSKLNLEAANLQVKIAQVNESAFFPTSPFTAVVEKVHVRVGQQVSPGASLVTISSSAKSQTAVAYVPQKIASSVSRLESSFLIIDDQKYEVTPIYVSQEAVLGQLYAIIFPVPGPVRDNLTDKGFVDVEIPVGYSYTSSAVPYIPLDAIHQTQDKAVVFIIKDQKAEDKTVTLGQVQGNFIEITSGLSTNDTVIVSRNIVASDSVKPKTP